MPPRPPGPEPWLWASCADGPGPRRAPRNFDHRVAGGTAAQPPPAGQGAQRESPRHSSREPLLYTRSTRRTTGLRTPAGFGHPRGGRQNSARERFYIRRLPAQTRGYSHFASSAIRGPHCQSGNPPIKPTSGTCPQSRALQVRRLRPTHCRQKTPLTATLQATPQALRLAAFSLRPAPGARLAANSPRLPSMSEILVPVSFGELLDKIAILQIKSE